jgi:hypothetical protein
MADATPPAPPSPAKAASAAHKGVKGVLTGKPTWMYVTAAAVVLGLALLWWRRGQSADPGPIVEDTTGASAGDPSLFPAASQGAYGGYSDPGVQSGATDTTPQQPIININVPGPTDSSGSGNAFNPADTSEGPSTATGGGTQPPRTTAQHQTPPTAPGFYTELQGYRRSTGHVYKYHHYTSGTKKGQLVNAGDLGKVPGVSKPSTFTPPAKDGWHRSTVTPTDFERTVGQTKYEG